MLAVTAYRRNNQTGNFLIINQIFQNPFFCFQIVKGQEAVALTIEKS